MFFVIEVLFMDLKIGKGAYLNMISLYFYCSQIFEKEYEEYH